MVTAEILRRGEKKRKQLSEMRLMTKFMRVAAVVLDQAEVILRDYGGHADLLYGTIIHNNVSSA